MNIDIYLFNLISSGWDGECAWSVSIISLDIALPLQSFHCPAALKMIISKVGLPV